MRIKKIGNSKGFTLIEVLIVVAIIGMIGAMAYPFLQRHQINQQIKSTLRNISLLLLKARMTACKTNGFVVINFENRYCRAFLDNGIGENGIARDWLQQSGEELVDEYVPPLTIILSSTFPKKNQLRFRNRIGVTPGTIIVSYNGRVVGKVVVNITGRTRIETFL